MHRRATGLLLALIILVLAVPATLGCCIGPPPHGGPPRLQPAAVGMAAAAVRAPAASAERVAFAVADADHTAFDSAAHECADHPAPPQTPYIEPSSGNGRGTAVPRTASAAISTVSTTTDVSAIADRHYEVAAEDTGPPIWLDTCVSRT